MKMLRRILPLTLALFFLMMPLKAQALDFDFFDEDDSVIYTLVDEEGNVLTQRAGRIYVDDEYITSDNLLYRVISVNDENHIAVAELVGEEIYDEEDVEATLAAFAASAEGKEENEVNSTKLIGMYSTHSDESYEPSDGTSSKMEGAGIYDVGDALKENLEKLGIEVKYDKETHHPHDAGA